MKEPSEIEVAGMFEGSDKGGQYLETIGKTDLSKMTEGEWMTFIETIIRGYEEKCMSLYGDPPF